MNAGMFLERKTLWMLLAGGGILVLIVLVVLGSFLFRDLPDEPRQEPDVKVGYCGAELSELCILSFGRDTEGNTLIDLFVPDEDFPDFYLKIYRAVGESLYECSALEGVPFRVTCVGPALNLNEQIEVELVSLADDRPLAIGRFLIKAILIASHDGLYPADGQTEIQSLGDPLEETNEAATPASTPIIGYPSPSYP
jgi:hypothetical protein